MTSRIGKAAMRSKKHWKEKGNPKRRSARAKHCPYCGRYLGFYKNPEQRKFAEEATPIEIECPRCGEKS